MELQYHKWLAIKIEHSYFINDNPPIRILPTQETKTILHSNNILFKETDGFIHFFIGLAPEVTAKSSIIENLDLLEFEVFTEDTLFFNYTELTSPNTDEYYFIKNTVESSTLQIEKVTDKEQVQKMKKNSFGMLQISTPDLSTENLSLSFDSRKVLYQYQIIINDSRKIEINKYNVVGFAQEEYEGPIEETIIGGQISQTFTSPTPLPLVDELAVNPLLKLHYKNSASIASEEFDMKLPNPSAENLKMDENNQLISSVIVYV